MKLFNMLKSQCKVMFSKRSFWLSFLIVLIYAIGSYGYHLVQYWGMDISAVYARSFLACINADSRLFQYFRLLFPFLVVFPFSMSYFEDVENNSIGFWIRRSGRTQYYFAKTVVCFAGCFVIIFVPFLINLLLVWGTFPDTMMTSYGELYSSTFFENVYDIQNMQYDLADIHFFIRHLFLYECGAVLSLSVFAGILGIVAFAFSVYIRKYKILLFLPVYLLFFILDMLDTMTDGIDFSLLDYVSVSFRRNKNGILFCGVCIVCFVVSMIIIYRQSRKDVL